MDKESLQGLRDIERASKPFFDSAEKNLVETTVAADPTGWHQAMNDRRLMAWLRDCAAARGDNGYPGIHWMAVLAIRKKWDDVDDKRSELVALYEQWEQAGQKTSAVLLKLLGS